MGTTAVEKMSRINNRVRHQFAVTLRGMLTRQELSEAEFSRQAGMPQRTINDITNERRAPSIETVAPIASALRIPMWQLFVWGRANSDASATRLDNLVRAYLSASASEREAFDRLAERVKG